MCDTIQRASGMETDTDGLLWVLDEGNSNCPGKLWIFNLLKNDKTERVHQFPHSVISHSNDDRWLNDIVLDKTPDDYLAYITVSESEKIIVYSRKLDKSWSVETPGRRWISLALSPIKEPRQLYLGRAFSEEMYSVSVSELKNEGGSAAVKFIGNWTKSPCRMLIDCSNVLYAAFALKTYLTKWNISEPFREQRLYEAEGMGHTHWPFTFDLDANGSFWMMERNLSEGWRKPRHKLLKAEVGAKSYIFCTSTALTTPQATAFSFNTILVWLLVCCLVLSGTLIAWLTLKMRRMQTSSRHISMDNLVFLGSKQSSTD
ncbi:uncharacterized protein LOC135938075 [Cloeon dipterum]|uniref:uncharacterized protein LOC135938075 n=1 Tax=Cloeon dipterum TaxID=197152 RepID=UPI00321F845C